MCLDGLIYKTKKNFFFLEGGGIQWGGGLQWGAREGEGRGYTYPMYCTHNFLHLYPPFGGQHVNHMGDIWEI